jgi:hypothetical protein
MRDTWDGGCPCGAVHFHLGAMDHPEELPPMVEFFPEERLPWLHVDVRGTAG